MPRSAKIGPMSLAWLAVLATADLASGQYIDAVDRYSSGGKAVTIEGYAPRLPGKYPAVFLLHGSGGLEQATGQVFRQIAATLAARGYVAFIPHIFEKTDHKVGAPFRTGEYDSWMAAVNDAVDYASTQPNVDARRVGFIGYSMGANLATIQGSRDPRVKAMVNVSGAYAPGTPRKKIPPLLILHGARDTSTPAALIKKYQERLEELEVPNAIHVYKGSGHNFDGATFADATGRAAQFFDRHLRQGDEPTGPRPASR